MTKIAMALAAASMLSAPAALAQSPYSTPPGKTPKVCLVTFADGSNTLASNVTKAQYVPLAIAEKLEARDTTDYQLVITYGTTGATGAGIDAAQINAGGFDIPNTFTSATTTEEACSFLADYAEENDDDSDD